MTPPTLQLHHLSRLADWLGDGNQVHIHVSVERGHVRVTKDSRSAGALGQYAGYFTGNCEASEAIERIERAIERAWKMGREG